MANEATIQIRMDAELKEQAETLYKNLGTSFAEAVRIFARQSVLEKAMPFVIGIPEDRPVRRIGLAEGKLLFPEDINKYDDEAAALFEGTL